MAKLVVTFLDYIAIVYILGMLYLCKSNLLIFFSFFFYLFILNSLRQIRFLGYCYSKLIDTRKP